MLTLGEDSEKQLQVSNSTFRVMNSKLETHSGPTLMPNRAPNVPTSSESPKPLRELLSIRASFAFPGSEKDGPLRRDGAAASRRISRPT